MELLPLVMCSVEALKMFFFFHIVEASLALGTPGGE